MRTSKWINTGASISRRQPVMFVIFTSLSHLLCRRQWKWVCDHQYYVDLESKLRISPIWKAKAEHKCRFFDWTLLHGKILTANNLQKKGWPSNPVCKLCNSEHESPWHLCKDCPYTKRVRGIISGWWNLTPQVQVDLQGSRNSLLGRSSYNCKTS